MANLLYQCGLAQGITGLLVRKVIHNPNFDTVRPPSGILVANRVFGVVEDSPNNAPYTRAKVGGNVTDAVGIEGQRNGNPHSWFDKQVIVHFDSTIQLLESDPPTPIRLYFDPSYGKGPFFTFWNYRTSGIVVGLTWRDANQNAFVAPAGPNSIILE